MELTEDEIIKNYGEHCGNCSRNTLLPYEYEETCVSCGCNVIKPKHELSTFKRTRINFVNRLKDADLTVFCICIDIH